VGPMRRGLLTGVLGLASLLVLVSPANAISVGSASAPPEAPVVTAVSAGVTSGAVTVGLAESPGVTGWEFSLNNGISWQECGAVAVGCTITGLVDDLVTPTLIRGVGEGGPGLVTPVDVTAVAPIPPLPKPRVWTSVSFNAAGNGLGVDGSKVKLGVGTLPELTFSRPITDKAAVERGLRVTATTNGRSPRVVPGAWGWLSDRRVVFRPKSWWPAHSVIIIKSDLGREVLGRSGGKFVIGRKDLNTAFTFRTGRKLVAMVDGAKKQMTVRIDGKTEHRFPVSLGKPGWETRNGPKIIYAAKQAHKVYTSQAIGITDPALAYSLPAKWNTRITPTGEFIHTATWAYGRLGIANGSHGCTNMREEHAKWIYDETVPGDVIDFKNTGGGTVESWNGPGGLWNIPWEQWLRKSALQSPTGKAELKNDPGSVASAPPVGA
jgi:lipoprotein-anchoring transpeptidase ErfK/SrfK